MEWNFHFFRWKWKRDGQKSDLGKGGRTKPYLATNKRSLTSILNWKTEKVKGPNLVLPATILTFAGSNENMKEWEVSQTTVVSTWQHNQNKIKAAFLINQVRYGFKMSMLKTKGLIYFSLFFSFSFLPHGLQCCSLQHFTKIYVSRPLFI